ncbi:MAG: hypothetical protein HY909_31575 [Deltaproteobacteria bacterium]|nr:hypothetical protein [Deltaproteobacteria bacterium]
MPADYQWRHTATSENTDGFYSFLNQTIINFRSEALITVTHRWNPAGDEMGIFNPHYFGVSYEAGVGYWAIVNVDGSPIPVGAAFDISAYQQPWIGGFIHSATPRNTYGNYTVINNPILNGRRDAVFFVTPRIPPPHGPLSAVDLSPFFKMKGSIVGGLPGAITVPLKIPVPVSAWPELNHPLGVWYDESTSRWNIFNQDYLSMYNRSSYNIEVLDYRTYGPHVEHVRVYVAEQSDHILEPVNYVDTVVDMDFPHQFMWVTSNISFRHANRQYTRFTSGRPDPRTIRAVPNPHPVGIWYNTATLKPSVFNEDGAAMRRGCGFNIRHGGGGGSGR